MKNFIFRTFITFSVIFIFAFCGTMLIETTNKQALNTVVNVEPEIINGKVEIPESPPKVLANYKFSEFYFYSNFVLMILVPILFFKFRAIDIVKNKKCKYNFTNGILIYLLYFAFSEVLSFPVVLLSSFYRARLVGLSHQSFIDFIANFSENFIINLIVTAPIIALIYVIFIRKKRWYILASVVLIITSVLATYAYPYIDEIENTLVPMESSELKDKLNQLATKAGIDNLDIMVIEKSSQTSGMNAYMTGINNSRRIVFWDTTLSNLSEKEILSVAGHEMGHYKLGHIQQSMIFGCIGIVIACILVDIIMKKLKGREYRTIDNIAVVIIVVNIIMIISTPIENAYSRKIETDADKFAVEVTGDSTTNAILEIRFINGNLSPVTVDKLYEILALDHPTAKERIEASNNMGK